MAPQKKCALRKTKAFPNVYLRKELEVKALAKGATKSEIRSMNKKELCQYLNIKWNEPKVSKKPPSRKKVSKKSGKKSSSRKKVKLIFLDDRPCNTVKSKLNPTAYSKDELVKLAMKKLGYTKAEATRKTKPTLCKELNGGKVSSKKPPSKKPPSKKAPPKPKKKVSPKKAQPKPKEDCISRSNLKLRDHQKRLVEYLNNHRGAVAVHGTGSGKTLTGVTTSQCFLDKHPDWKVLVITPTSLQENFKKEMVAYGADPNDPRYTFMTLTKFGKDYQNKQCNPDTLLIIDEAHNLRTDIVSATYNAKKRAYADKRKPNKPVAKVAIECAKNVDKVLLLTATPLYNKPADIVNLVAMVKGKDPVNSKTIDAYMNNPTQLRNYLACVFDFYDVPRSEEYPEVEEHDIRIIMTPAYYKKYREVEMKQSPIIGNPWVFLTGIRQATNALDPCQKCEWAVNKIKKGKKTVLYSAFKTYGVRKIQNMLKSDDIQYGEITGGMTQKQRNETVRKFNTDDLTVLFITKAGGEGLDLKGVRDVILLESGWNRPGEEQVIGRAARYRSHAHLPKNQRKVDVYRLMIVKPAKKYDENEKPSADEMLDEMIKEKEKRNNFFLNKIRELSIENC